MWRSLEHCFPKILHDLSYTSVDNECDFTTMHSYGVTNNANSSMLFHLRTLWSLCHPDVKEWRACLYLAVHPAESAFLDDEVTGRLQEVGAEVTLLDVLVLVTAVSRPGPGPDSWRKKRRTDIKSTAGFPGFNLLSASFLCSGWQMFLSIHWDVSSQTFFSFFFFLLLLTVYQYACVKGKTSGFICYPYSTRQFSLTSTTDCHP